VLRVILVGGGDVVCFDAATERITEGPPPAHAPPVVDLLKDQTLLLGPSAL
jgi:hypothetical protein